MRKLRFYKFIVVAFIAVSSLLFWNVLPDTSPNIKHRVSAQVTQTVTILPGTETTDEGEIDYYNLNVEPVIVFPRIAQAGATSNYEVEFPADLSIPSGGKIILYFPAGFNFIDSCSSPLSTIENNDINGPSPGIITIASVECITGPNTLAVTTAGAATQAGDRIRFLVQGIVNSAHTEYRWTR